MLDAVQAKLGLTPNMMKTMQSPAVLEAYLNFSGALAEGALDAQFREEIALTVAQANSCEYCLSAHTTIGGLVKLTKEEIAGARQAQEKQAKRDAGLKFAQAVVIEKGEVSDEICSFLESLAFAPPSHVTVNNNLTCNNKKLRKGRHHNVTLKSNRTEKHLRQDQGAARCSQCQVRDGPEHDQGNGQLPRGAGGLSRIQRCHW